jgi:hypothetical protein
LAKSIRSGRRTQKVSHTAGGIPTRAERFARRRLDERVPTARRAGTKEAIYERTARGRPVDDSAVLAMQRRLQLRRDELTVEIVLVVDGRRGQMDLGGPVGSVPPRRSVHQLEALDEIPPT